MLPPELKQFGELDPEDFQHHPVWIGCHTADYGQPWYEDTDEETFRPYKKKLPADAGEGMLLVKAVIELKDGSRYPGFVSPGVDLGTQQPQIFFDDRHFGFWGGMPGVSERSQQELYAALRKTPDSIFPLRFKAEAGLTTDEIEGQIEGFYKKSRDGIHISFTPWKELTDAPSAGAQWFQMSARSHRGYPQPEAGFEYLKIVYEKPCLRCGIFERQKAAFRFKKSIGAPAGFTQLTWVYDAFFAPPSVVAEIMKAGISGVSPGPAVFHRSGEECSDRVQLLIPTVIPCLETSLLPTVTCQPDNEEARAIRALFPKQQTSSAKAISPELEEHFRKERERLTAIPYCGRVKRHPPTSIALIPDHVKGAPDLFQSEEWFGSGACAFRLTFASERFTNLVRERGWKGLEFHIAPEMGFSDRPHR